jgi:hypothetical protein
MLILEHFCTIPKKIPSSMPGCCSELFPVRALPDGR